MSITKEYLVSMKNSAEEQRSRAIQLVHEANGAIAMLQVMLDKLDAAETKPEINEDT
jgi:hypothetical protein